MYTSITMLPYIKVNSQRHEFIMLSLSYIKLGVLTWYEYNVGMMGDADEQPWYLLYFLQKFDCLFASVIK